MALVSVCRRRYRGAYGRVEVEVATAWQFKLELPLRGCSSFALLQSAACFVIVLLRVSRNSLSHKVLIFNDTHQQHNNMEEHTNSAQNYKGLARAAWIIIGVICLIALIPAVGLLTWFIAFPVLVATFVLGIIAITRGGTLQGVLILLVSLIVAPAYLLVAPMLSTFVFAMVYGDPSEKVADRTELNGEHQADGGLIYYFNDGVVAVDTRVTPFRYHIYAVHPEGRKVKKVDLIEDGIDFALVGGTELPTGVSVPVVAGKVHVITEELDKDGKPFTVSRHLAIDPETIKQLLNRGDWNASIRELCGLVPQQPGEDNAAGEEMLESEPSEETSPDAGQGEG
jgi:flagellar basal body-associated protein FliL